jgi:GTPase
VTTAEAGQCVSLALKRVRRAAVRKGMVIVSKLDTPPRGKYFVYWTLSV